MYSTWPNAIPNGPLDLYSLAIRTRTDNYEKVRRKTFDSQNIFFVQSAVVAMALE